MGFNEVLNTIGNFLQSEIFVNSFISIDIWSLIHFGTGGIIMFAILHILNKKSMQYKFLLLFFFLAIWEVFEFSFYSRGIFFGVETSGNVLWDLIFGMIGGFTSSKIYAGKKK